METAARYSRRRVRVVRRARQDLEYYFARVALNSVTTGGRE